MNKQKFEVLAGNELKLQSKLYQVHSDDELKKIRATLKKYSMMKLDPVVANAIDSLWK